ncbi:MAG: hypothetical protein FJW30_26520 [Acidobacteria bacterium]|nr:hypothetical protein [Acidobacteriota bacterium]
MRWIRLCVCAPVLGFGQQAGVLPDWEARKLLESLVENARKIEPMLAELRPAEWIAHGAPDAYVLQHRRVSQSIATLHASSTKLAAQPGRVNAAVETLFALENVQTYLGSVAQGVRRYQNPALADLLVALSDENGSNREKLKMYVLDLANSKESELQVMDGEAQRCRDILVRQPPPAKPRAIVPKLPAPAKPKDRL